MFHRDNPLLRAEWVTNVKQNRKTSPFRGRFYLLRYFTTASVREVTCNFS